jgi:hypothetical protein
MVACICHLSGIKEEDFGAGQTRQVRDPISKIINAKQAGGMAQVVQLLPSKCKALIQSLYCLPPSKKFPRPNKGRHCLKI